MKCLALSCKFFEVVVRPPQTTAAVVKSCQLQLFAMVTQFHPGNLTTNPNPSYMFPLVIMETYILIYIYYIMVNLVNYNFGEDMMFVMFEM